MPRDDDPEGLNAINDTSPESEIPQEWWSDWEILVSRLEHDPGYDSGESEMAREEDETVTRGVILKLSPNIKMEICPGIIFIGMHIPFTSIKDLANTSTDFASVQQILLKRGYRYQKQTAMHIDSKDLRHQVLNIKGWAYLELETDKYDMEKPGSMEGIIAEVIAIKAEIALNQKKIN